MKIVNSKRVNQITKLRTYKGFKLKDLAAAIGVSAVTMANIEKRETVFKKYLSKIAEVLEVNENQLINTVETTNERLVDYTLYIVPTKNTLAQQFEKVFVEVRELKAAIEGGLLHEKYEGAFDVMNATAGLINILKEDRTEEDIIFNEYHLEKLAGRHEKGGE